MNRVIVTGANGFIGRNFVQSLSEKHVHVVAVARSFEKSSIQENKYITKLEIDNYESENLVNSLPKGEYDAFYHFAWQGVSGDDKSNPIVQTNNIRMMIYCASAAKSLGCRVFLCAGTIAEQVVNSLGHLDTISGGVMYGTAKHCAHLILESYCKLIGLTYVWMQLSNIYGSDDTTGNLISYTTASLVLGRAAEFGSAEQPYDFIYIDDAIEAMYRIGELEYPENFYFIGSGKPQILQDYLFAVGDAFKRKDLIKFKKRPDDGIVYTWEMFDVSSLVRDVGEYAMISFEDRICSIMKNITGGG